MIITVTQLNNYIKGTFDMDSNLVMLSVSGEVTNAKLVRNCWYYTLKDDNSQIDCFSYQTDVPEVPNGLQLVATGSLNFLTKSGKVSMFVKKVKLSDKLGEQYLRLLALQKKLQAEGLFDPEHKQDVPRGCKKVGIVTSKTGAVIKDIQDVAFRRQPYVDLVLYPVHVQGMLAEDEIVEAINYFSTSNVDAVIVARGGGSNEDLSVFNSEKIVRAIYNCTKPTVSAIGHGVDFTLVDFAADRRAVTPSEAAEFVTIDYLKHKQALLSSLQHVATRIKGRIDGANQRCNAATSNLCANATATLTKRKNNVVMQLQAMSYMAEKRLDNASASLQSKLMLLDTSNPVKILSKGFAVVQKDDKRVKSANDLQPNDQIEVSFVDGRWLQRWRGSYEYRKINRATKCSCRNCFQRQGCFGGRSKGV